MYKKFISRHEAAGVEKVKEVDNKLVELKAAQRQIAEQVAEIRLQ